MDSRNAELRVVIGAGEYNNNPDWIQTQESEHVWEHLDFEEGIKAAKICFEFLMPGGYIRCAVPDGYFPNDDYQRGVQIGGPGPADHPAASHKIVHTYKTLSSMFERAGFNVNLLEYCDENGEFHFNEWDEQKGFIYRSKRLTVEIKTAS